MKGKKFYFLLMGLILVGIGSVYFYRQQEEQRILEFEGYEISAIEGQVQDLYNEEKTDISQNISNETLEELELIFEELDEKKLSRRSRDQIRDLELDFLIARSMLETEEEVEAIFVENDIVDHEIIENDIDALETDVLAFENMPDYVDRNIERLAYGRRQVITNQQVKEFVESLFDEEGNVLESVTREDEEEAREMLASIQNEELREELTERVESLSLALTEREEQLAIEEALELQEEAEVEEAEELEGVDEWEEPEYTAPPAQPWTPTTPPSSTPSTPARPVQPTQPSRPSGGGSSSGGTGNTGGTQPPQDSDNGAGDQEDENEPPADDPTTDENGSDESNDEEPVEEEETQNPTWESQY